MTNISINYKADIHPYVKDPSIVPLPNGSYYMYATLYIIDGPAWIGLFHAPCVKGPWNEIGAVKIKGTLGPQMFAPAVIYDEKQSLYRMYIQTACLEEDGKIIEAVSDDGINFVTSNHSLFTKNNITDYPVVGLYDAGASGNIINYHHKQYVGFALTGYRFVGSGDIYLALKAVGAAAWSSPTLALRQEDVHCHNQPNDKNFEWGLEGASAPIQLRDNLFMIIGVCFKPDGAPGQRQRVFWAISPTPLGPYTSMGILFKQHQGENGHADVIVTKNDLEFIYQAREHIDAPWHLRYKKISKDQFIRHADAKLNLMVRQKTKLTHAAIQP